MDIQQAIAPQVPQVTKAQPTDKHESLSQEQTSVVDAAHFATLLQEMQGANASPEPLMQETSLHTDLAEMQSAELAPEIAVQDGLSADAASGVAMVPADQSFAAFNLDSLVNQTRRLDGHNLDADLQDGSLLQQRKLENGGADLLQRGANLVREAGAQAAVAVGQQVATVAAGVNALAPHIRVATETAAPLMAAGLAVLSEATGAVNTAVQAMTDMAQIETAGEGRITLQGAWQLEDPEMALPPVLHRLMGQVEQWAAATAGVQPKVQERVEGSKQMANGLQWMSTDQGSGTALTENAVQEAQQTQDAAMDTRADEPVQDMRFWLQGKQQRAQVVMEKDGQSVRVQVALRGNSAQVSFHADQLQTREMLDAGLEQLRGMLQDQGLELSGVSVQAQTQEGGDQQTSEQQRTPWDAAPVQHAQVKVPVADAATPRTQQPMQGVSFYA